MDYKRKNKVLLCFNIEKGRLRKTGYFNISFLGRVTFIANSKISGLWFGYISQLFLRWGGGGIGHFSCPCPNITCHSACQ
jgi:hypothetical protein